MAAEVEAQARAELDGISLAGFGGVMFSPPLVYGSEAVLGLAVGNHQMHPSQPS